MLQPISDRHSFSLNDNITQANISPFAENTNFTGRVDPNDVVASLIEENATDPNISSPNIVVNDRNIPNTETLEVLAETALPREVNTSNENNVAIGNHLPLPITINRHRSAYLKDYHCNLLINASVADTSPNDPYFFGK